MSHRHEATLGFFVLNRLFFGESDPVECLRVWHDDTMTTFLWPGPIDRKAKSHIVVMNP